VLFLRCNFSILKNEALYWKMLVTASLKYNYYFIIQLYHNWTVILIFSITAFEITDKTT